MAADPSPPTDSAADATGLAAVLGILARMEQRDLQALSTIEALARALKTVGQHLAGLRHAVQASTRDTAAGFALIGHRLDQLEQRLGLPAVAGIGHNSQLADIADRLAAMEEMIGRDPALDPMALARLLENVTAQMTRVEEKVEDLASSPVDLAPVTSRLETIVQRVSTVERKVDENRYIDVTPLRDALESIARRVARIERRLDHTPDARPAEPFDTAAITALLEVISRRIGAMESRAESGPDVQALTHFLDMINQRLQRMEAGLGARPHSDATEPQDHAPPAPAPAETGPVPPPPAEIISPAATPPAARQQVDVLLEQVLRALSR